MRRVRPKSRMHDWQGCSRRPSYGGLIAYSPDCLSYYCAGALEGASRRSGAVMSSQKAETTAEKSICVKRREWERWG